MGSNPHGRRGGAARGAGAVLVIALATSLCACSSLGDSLPAPLGLPQSVPERPAVQPEFLPVHDMPPPRDTKPLTEKERKQLEADLREIRDRQGRRDGKPSSKQPAEKSPEEGRPAAKSPD